MTDQRAVIEQVLFSVSSHPSADEIVDTIRRCGVVLLRSAIAAVVVDSVRAALERFEQRMRIGLAAADHGFRHQIGRGNADRAATRLEAGVGDRAVGGIFHPHLDAVAAHRVVALRGGIETFQPLRMPRAAAVIQDHFLIKVAQIVECIRAHIRRFPRHAKNSLTRISDSAR